MLTVASAEARRTGGGIGTVDSDITIENNLIQNNFSDLGGGVSANGGNVVLRNNIISGNTGIGDHGGGLYITSPNVTISDNLIFNNEIGRDIDYGWGGGLVVLGRTSEAVLTGNIIYNNYAPTSGGGVFIDDGATASLKNELIYGNTVMEAGGAGVYVDGLDQDGSIVTIDFCTIADNGPEGWLGGNAVLAEQYSQVTVSNSILWNNGDDLFADETSLITLNHTLAEEAISGEGNLSKNPLFADSAAGDYHLQSRKGRYAPGEWLSDAVDSPAIDAAALTMSYGIEPTPNGTRANLGAYGNTVEASLSSTAPALCQPPLAQTPVIGLSGNNQSMSTQITTGDTLALTLNVSTGVCGGANADWWIIESGPEGLRYYNLAQSQFVDTFAPTYQGPLFNLNNQELHYIIDAVGDYLYYFAVDISPDNTFGESENKLLSVLSGNNTSADELFYYNKLSVTAVSVETLPVVPKINAGSQAGPTQVSTGDTVDLTIELSTGNHGGALADWWLIESGPSGFRHFDLAQGQFDEGFLPTYQGPLFNLNTFSLSQRIDDDGIYRYYFAVDLVPNNSYTAGEEAYIASVEVSATSPENESPTSDSTVRVYVAGESVEEMNRFIHPPFNEDGSLNGFDNTSEEYGWMVPFAERLQLRAPDLSVEWVGSSCWMGWDWECSDGTYPPNQGNGLTSALSGTTVEQWLNEKRDELVNQSHCYDVAFASRGGNDLNNAVPENTFRENLRELILLLDGGSSCREHPIIYVTSHMLDIAGGVEPYSTGEVTSWMNTQQSYYVTTPKNLVDELTASNPALRLRFIDMWTPFHEDWQTTAFPAENWWSTINGVSAPDLNKIHRENDYWSAQHPLRLASIFAGENVADQVDLEELRNLIGH